MPLLRSGEIAGISADILGRLGAPNDIAEAVAGWLVGSDLSGHASHGVIKVGDYAGRIRDGEIIPYARPTVDLGADGGSLVLVNGHAGFGHLSAHLLTETLVERTQSEPVVLGGIINASHTGRLGEWAELAARGGTVMLMFSASVNRGTVVPFGGREPRLGTNPMALSVPAANDDSLILDFATSAVAGGRLKQLRDSGASVPPGSLIDQFGNPTIDPGALAAGGMLLTFGGHKGYGLSLVVSLIAGCIVGEAADGTFLPGVLAIAFNPGAFADRQAVLESIERQLARMRDTEPGPGFDRVEVPGDFERRHREQSGGIVDLPDATWASLVSLGESLGMRRDQLQAALAPEGQS